MSVEVHLFDEVTLTDEAVGICKFIGEIKGKKGVFYGIDIKKGEGKNNGCIKNKRYFRTKNNKQTGRFTQISKIMKTTKTVKSIPFAIGDKMNAPQLNATAIIRYTGIPAFDKTMKTVYFGIELSEPKGDCDGELYSAYLGKKISYFKCGTNHGLYIKSNEVKINYISENNHDDENNNNYNDIDDEKTVDNNKDEEITRLKKQIENLKNNDNENGDNYYNTEYEKLMKEYVEYKQDAERNKDRMDKMEKQLQDNNDLNDELQKELNKIKKELQEKDELNIELQEQLKSLKESESKIENALKLTNEVLTTKTQQVDKLKNELDELLKSNNDNDIAPEPSDIDNDKITLKAEIDRLSEENKTLKQKIKSLKTNKKNGNNNNNNSLSTEYLEKELEELKMKKKIKQKKQRISGVLTKFAATDINSATVILKEILKQWDSKFISANSRVEYLKNFVEVLKVIKKTININQKNKELDPIINNVLDIMQKCRDSKDDCLRDTASSLCQDDVILQFMMR